MVLFCLFCFVCWFAFGYNGVIMLVYAFAVFIGIITL